MYRHALLQSRQRLLNTATPPRPAIIHCPSFRSYSDHPPNNSYSRRSPHPHRRSFNDKQFHPLIPQAYRRRLDDNETSSNKYYNSHYSKHHRNNTPNNPRIRKNKSRIHFNPRLSPPHKNIKRHRIKGQVDKDTLSSLENGLMLKWKEYKTRLLYPIHTDDFGKMALMQKEKEEMERDFPSLTLDNAYDNNGNDTHVDVTLLYATEEMYTDIITDFQALILGYCHLAEGLCGARRMENIVNSSSTGASDHNNGKENGKVGRKEYETTVGKAESYLEALETFCRNRMEAVDKCKRMVVEGKGGDQVVVGDHGSPNGKKMLENVGSFLRGVLFTERNSNDSTTPDFDEAWKKADGTTKNTTLSGPITPENFDDFIKAHKNEESQPDMIALYEHMFSANTAAYVFGNQAKLDSAERSNRLLSRWISLHCLQTKNSKDGCDEQQPFDTKTHNVEALEDSEYETKYPEQRLFHIVMRQNADLWSFDGSQRVEEWLRRMESLQQGGHIQCAPDVHAYNLVLLSYCNLCKNSSPVLKQPQAGGPKGANRSSGSSFDEMSSHNISHHVRKFILHGAENILMELSNSKDVDPNVLSLNLALNAIAKAGKIDSDTCAKTDRLLSEVLGEDRFKCLINDVQDANEMKIVDSHQLEPDLDTYHWLVNIYSGGNLFYIKRTMLLLEKMMKMRTAIIESDDDEIIAPSTGTFNNALRALQCKVDELSRLSRLGDAKIVRLTKATRQELQDYSPIDIAKAISPMVDAMVQFESSMPTRVTFLFMLQIWSRTKSKEAGDRAEELLSRMETIDSYKSLKPYSNAYMLVLRNWLTSADAGRPGAVERANRLLEIIEAQTGEVTDTSNNAPSEDLSATAIGIATDRTDELSNEFDDIYDKTMYDYNKLYPMMLRICSVSTGKEDTVRAVEIAFQTCEKMMSRGQKPRGKAFELLYSTVNNYAQCHPGVPESEKKKLKDRVFSLAEQCKVSRGELIGRWQQVQQRTEAADVNEEDDSEITVEDDSSEDQLLTSIK